METIWFIGFLFTIGFVGCIGKDETAMKVGWKGMFLLLLANLFLFVLCLIFWPAILGNDIKKRMIE